MNDKKFFTLNPDCILVSGALRGALYDLKSGKIFSIDQNSAKILERLENGSNLGTALENTDFGIEELLGYLSHLEILGLGKFVDNDYPRKKIEIKKPKEELNFIHLELTERCNLHCLHCYNAILSNESENEKMMLSD